MKKITTPKEFFGFTPGDDYELARWDKVVEYFYLLEKESDRIQVKNVGPSTLGQPFLEVTITSPENMAELDEYKAISMKLADPRGLSEAEIAELVKKGKTVSLQTMSMHADEVGGTQMSVVLAYDLCSKDDEEVLRILDQTIFVMFPCENPDGQIWYTDWYYKWKGTDYEGTTYPMLYHWYTGHDNNRDAISFNIVETQYVGQAMFHEWMPQSYQDHHHMGRYGARIFIAPYKASPLRPHVDPLVWRELNWYGANMAYQMDENGLDGVTSGAQYPSWGHYGFHWMTNSHNIPGMLTESASARLATPVYIDPTQLIGDGDNFMPKYEAQTNFPSPWPGGWWRIGDIVARQYTSAYALLDTMARNREQILENMAKKALHQTARGAEDEDFAYIIPADQHDKFEVRNLIKRLRNQNIEVSVAQKPFTVGSATYPAGTFVVFLAQPKFGLIKNLIGKTLYVKNAWTRDPKTGAYTAFDSATDTINEYMNVAAIPAGQPFEGSFKKLEGREVEYKYALPKGGKVVLSAKENSVFMTVNALLKEGFKVYRCDECPWHDFYAEGDEKALAKILKAYPTEARAVEKKPAKLTAVKALKIGMYQRYNTGNADEGWTRLFFDTYGFEYKTLLPEDIKKGIKGIDVLILPSDTAGYLLGGDYLKNDPAAASMMRYYGRFAPGYESGFGVEGMNNIKEFVSKGGKLLAFNNSSNVIIDWFDLEVRNVTKGVPNTDFNTHGSTIRSKVDITDPVCYGMNPDTLIFHWNGPSFEISSAIDADKYKMPVRFADHDLLRSGLLVGGDEYMAGKGAVVTCNYGKGDVVLYAFSPQH